MNQHSLKTSFHDRVYAMLIALLILGGAFVAMLFGLWLSSQVFARPRAVSVELVPRGDGAGTDVADQVDPDVLAPGSEFEQDEATLLETMESVMDIVSKNSALFSDASPVDDALLMPGGKQGDGRTRGEGLGQAGRIRRWEFNFERAISVNEYAAMLDFFGIELGILRPGGTVVYASKLAAARPVVREGASAEEQRYYMTWLKGDRENADRELLEKAGVDHQGRFILKFLPRQLEAELEEMEKTRAGNREQEIKSSFFRVSQEGGQYKFYLYRQVF